MICCDLWGGKTLPELLRLFQPKSIVVYGGSWAENVIQQCQKMGFSGNIWPIHPHRKSISGLVCFTSISELPGVPDAAFLGINRDAVIEVTRQLAEMDVAARFVLPLALPKRAILTCNNSLLPWRAICRFWAQIATGLSII